MARCNNSDNYDSFRVISRDAEGVLLSNLPYKVFNQLTDPDGVPYFGTTAVATGMTDSGGQTPYGCVVKSSQPYIAKFYEFSDTYGFSKLLFPQMSVVGDFITAEVRMSYMQVTLRDAEGTVLKNAKFDVYTQTFDVNGNPIIDETKINQAKLVHSNYTTGAVGSVRAYLGQGNYVLRVHGSVANSYFYVWNQRVTDGQSIAVDYKLATLRTVILDGYNAVIKNQAISIYEQAYDVRGLPIIGNLVTSLNTGDTGKADAYIPAGAYAIKIPGSYAGSNYYAWRSQVSEQLLTTVNYRLSGFRITISDNAGVLKKNSLFSLATQKLDAQNAPIADTTIVANASTGETGFKDVYLTPGSYVLIFGTEKVFNLEVFDTQFTKVDYPKKIQIRPRPDIRITSSLANKNLTAKIIPGPKITGLNKFKKIIGKSFAIRATKLTQPYTFTYLYNIQILNKYNTSASKVRLAFYSLKTKKWAYVGVNDPVRMLVSANLRDQGTIVLVMVN